MEVDPDSPIYPAQTGTYSFLDPPTAPRKMAEAQVQLPTLDAGKTKGRLLVFLSTKGGSGVTTVACTFALTLARESGKRVLLIDLTLSRGDVALNLGIQALHTTLDAFQNFSRMDRSYLSSLPERHSSGLFVLAAPGDFAGVDVSREAICKLLEVAGEEFDYVVVDAGSTLDRKHIYDFGKSSIIYVVTQIGIAELRNSNRLISKFPREGGPEIEIVINRYDPRSQEIDDDHVTKALTRPARWRIPNDYAAVRRMQITATPLSGSSPVSRTILQMIKRVLGSRGTLQPSKEINLFGWKLSRR
jgi:pilus assembly protein CpaE